MRLALIISGLRIGGAERVMTRLANGWVERGREVHLLTFDPIGGEAFPLDARVHRTCASGDGSFGPGPIRVLQRVQALRRVLNELQPDAVLSFGDRSNVVTLLATRGAHWPVVVSERTDPVRYSPGRGWSLLRDWLYPRASTLVLQTEQVRAWAQGRFPRLKTAVIPNPAPDIVPAFSDRAPVIVAAGRLSREKGFDLLLRAYAAARESLTGWELEIYGSGPARPQLEQLIDELRLAGRARLCGAAGDLTAVLRRAGLFVLSSRFEGFPNVLLEAMAAGAPTIACAGCTGPGDLLRPEETGLLAPRESVSGLARGLVRLARDAALRDRLSRAAAQDVSGRFRLTHVLDLWEDTLGPGASETSLPVHRRAA